MIISDIYKCFSDYFNKTGVNLFICRFDFIFGYDYVVCVKVITVEFLSIFKYCFIAAAFDIIYYSCLLYTSPSPRDA